MIIPETDSVLAAMRKYGAQETRDEYIYWAFAGNPPDEIDAEVESTFPPQFRRDALDTPKGSYSNQETRTGTSENVSPAATVAALRYH